jgi:8-oxo-dGTP diphosphatase
MEAAGEQAYQLMNDVRAVDWLPLEAAVGRLSRAHEQAFLEHVGPQALSAFTRRPKAKPPASRKRRGQPAATEPARAEPMAEAPPSLSIVSPQPELPREPAVLAEIADDAVVAGEMSVSPADPEIAMDQAEPDEELAMSVASDDVADSASVAADRQRRSLAQKVRDWLGRAA